MRVRRRHRRRASASDHGRGRDPDRGRLAKRSFRTKIILRCSAFHVQNPYPILEPAMQRGNFEGHVLDSLKERKSRVPTCAAQNSTRTVCSCIPDFEGRSRRESFIRGAKKKCEVGVYLPQLTSQSPCSYSPNSFASSFLVLFCSLCVLIFLWFACATKSPEGYALKTQGGPPHRPCSAAESASRAPFRSDGLFFFFAQKSAANVLLSIRI